MNSCCEAKSCEIEVLRAKQAGTLKVVLAINATMFVVELVSGLFAGSVSLLADSLDMLGDALVYGLSIYAVTRGDRQKAISALAKGYVMLGFAVFVLVQAGYRVTHPQSPEALLMGAVGLLALAANCTCLALLWRRRDDDINMQSVWLCSRNDIIANVAVLLAAVLVWWSDSPWPDLIVGVALAVLFAVTATSVLRQANTQLRVADA
ncbi:MAG: cation diffusion facilitator family transporter [Caldimonas sp.]